MRLWKTSVLALAFVWTASAQIPDFTPPTPLIGALMHNDTKQAKQLIAAGADVNEPKFYGFPPVFFPVIYQNLDLLHAMLDKGANVKAVDASGSTALMWAAFNEAGDAAMVEELLWMGLDPNAKNKTGESALTWASRRGDTRVVAMLRKAGASNMNDVKDAAQRALNLLQSSSPQFLKVSGCVSCHHQILPQMAAVIAREKGLAVDEAVSKQQTQWAIATMRPMREEILTKRDKLPDPPLVASYALMGLAAAKYPADETTAALADLISYWQREDGGFQALAMRPPIEYSDFAATALSLRALQIYGTNSEERVGRAAEWLRHATPKTNEDRVMQLLGLGWANAASDENRARAQALISEQRPDGGWAQLPGLETDAYATGQALVALHWGARVPVTDPVYQRGVAYLLRTQLADGSWLVRSRSFPLQPYKESGFPHGKDQWISATGTSWAAMALTLALPLATPHGSSSTF